ESTRSVALDAPIARPVEPVAPVVPADPTSVAPAAPLVEVPAQVQPEPEPEEPSEPLPSLNDSDTFVMFRLASMVMGASLLRMLTPNDLVRKFVVFVTNVRSEERRVGKECRARRR